MIPANVITAWAVEHPWPTRLQVEQDLLLSQAICEIANHRYLGEELVFRGGTALHKLHVPALYRYSEDLDYVRVSAGGIGEVTRTLTDLGTTLGYQVTTKVGMHPKVYWKTTAQGGTTLRIKVEVNTFERSPALGHTHIGYSVETDWWSGIADVKTFQLPELVATKIRALYQRAKGRDVFDLWLARTALDVDPRAIAAAFTPYRPEGWTPAKAERNLRDKLDKHAYRDDLRQLIRTPPAGFDLEVAVDLLLDDLISHVDRWNASSC
ncbi:MAG TPA: nucleotidyl transferase AbiEii/AbiGii toxin family protein [Nocardioidaceae bacterium]|nr:nucleotidyl transferase AbiEii/AbiGii toxin family protein [Nocardioidaceae bacterium]